MRRTLTRHGLVGSMGRVGSSGDNAAMESFFALLQKNDLDHQGWTAREQCRIADRDLDRADPPPPTQTNPPRPMTPIEYKTITSTTPAFVA